MKVRRREVNIFNMSLLDILCGALGAFCFMMLALFPSYIEAQKHADDPDAEERIRRAESRAADAEARAEDARRETAQATADQTMVAFVLHWNTDDDVDLWIGAARDRWWGAKKERLPGGTLAGTFPDSRSGLKASEGFWIWNSGEPNGFYRVYAELAGRQSGSDPVDVRISGACRFFNAKGEKSMALPVTGSFQLSRVGERVQVGAIEFDQTGSMKSFRWGAPAPGS